LIQLIIVITNQSSKENLHLIIARTSIQKEKEGRERERESITSYIL